MAERWVINIKLIKLKKSQLPKFDGDYFLRFNPEDCKVLLEEETGWNSHFENFGEAFKVINSIVKNKDWRTVETVLDVYLSDYMETNKVFVSFDIVKYVNYDPEKPWVVERTVPGFYQVPVRLFIEKEYQQVYGMKIMPIKNDLIKDFEAAYERHHK